MADDSSKRSRNSRKLLGYVNVDAGLIYIGDPSYLIGSELGAMPWDQFLETYIGAETELAYPVEDGTAIVTTTGYGDGIYPVYATIRDGRVMAITISFEIE
jgi:hypothetical protein